MNEENYTQEELQHMADEILAETRSPARPPPLAAHLQDLSDLQNIYETETETTETETTETETTETETEEDSKPAARQTFMGGLFSPFKF